MLTVTYELYNYIYFKMNSVLKKSVFTVELDGAVYVA